MYFEGTSEQALPALSWGWLLEGPSQSWPSQKITQGLDTNLQSGQIIVFFKCLKYT